MTEAVRPENTLRPSETARSIYKRYMTQGSDACPDCGAPGEVGDACTTTGCGGTVQPFDGAAAKARRDSAVRQ